VCQCANHWLVSCASITSQHQAAADSREEDGGPLTQGTGIARALWAIRVPYRRMGPIDLHLSALVSLSHATREQPNWPLVLRALKDVADGVGVPLTSACRRDTSGI
jgi:hypothetical protein